MITPLVSRGWLAARLDDPSLVIIDLRLAIDGGRAAYQEAHIPGAIFSDYAADGWRQRVGDVPGLLPDSSHRATLFGKLGITPESHVILVPVGTSANDFAASARAYWTLKISGHAAVSILDGGTRGWRADSVLPITSGDRTPQDAGAYPVCEKAGQRAVASAVLDAVQSGSHQLIDARSASYFSGAEKASEARRAGHIPGAHSLDYVQAFDISAGALRPREALEALFRDAPARPVISYCNTGHTAALNWFVMSELLGWPGVALYDGSMTDWTQDDARPVEPG